MANRNNQFKTPSWTSPKGGTRGCLCPDGKYSSKCCDGSLQAQGIGNIYGAIIPPIPVETGFILLENGSHLLTETNHKILKET